MTHEAAGAGPGTLRSLPLPLPLSPPSPPLPPYLPLFNHLLVWPPPKTLLALLHAFGSPPVRRIHTRPFFNASRGSHSERHL